MTSTASRSVLRTFGLLGSLAILAGCSQAAVVTASRAFNRPARVTFVCFDDAGPTTLDACRVVDGVRPAGFTLFALVPQQTRGEVAAVNLWASPAPQVIDSDRRVPGFTFVPVGEVPGAIAISPRDARCTWVANRGSRDLSAVETVRFREESLATFDTGARLSLRGTDADGDVAASGRPGAMVLVEQDGAGELWVTLPEDGAVARVPVASTDTGCSFGALDIVRLPLDRSLIPEAASMSPARLETDAASLAVCPASASQNLGPVVEAAQFEPLPEEPSDPLEDLLGPPEPRALVVESDADGAATAVLIGDAARPVVYRWDLRGSAWAGSLRTDGPVLDLALTPPVPDTLSEGSPERRYLYVADARDGSVMVLDASDGTLLPVAAEGAARPTRVPFRAPVRALEVVGDPSLGGVCDASPAPGPAVLRGVFVAAALTDGTVRIIDVYDRDAPCRTGDGCIERFTSAETVSYVRRHRPRIGVRVASPVTVREAPVFLLAGSTTRYDDLGVNEGQSSAPRLEALDACPEGQGRVFPIGVDPARMCSVVDPWSAEPEAWSVAWQGVVPGTAGASGHFVASEGGTLTLGSRLDLCGLGVLGPLGASEVAPGEPEFSYAGDLLAITTRLPSTAEIRADEVCSALAGLNLGDQQKAILVPILDVVGGAALSGAETLDRSRIVVRADEPILDRAPVLGATGARALTMQDVLRCFADRLVSYEVRTRESFAVVVARSGFQHRVVADATTGRCVVSSDPQRAARQGRARLGVPFVSTRMAFTLSYPPDGTPSPIPEGAVRFEVGNVPVQLGVDLGAVSGGTRAFSVPTALAWSAVDGFLYAVDETRRGLVQVALVGTGGLAITRVVE